jgi:hypothetical protein
MPQSDHWALPWVIETVMRMEPKSVLDVGVGNGQYGIHLRQLLDIGPGRLTKAEWTTRLDGIELFEAYRNPIWAYCYDEVHIGDCRQILERLDRNYDLILICDVIEHFEREEALRLLDVLRRRAKWVIVTTPNGPYTQGTVFGNEGEIHRSEWRPKDFQRIGGATHEIATTFMAVFSGYQTGISSNSLTSDLPILFHHTGRNLLRCVREWLPKLFSRRVGKYFRRSESRSKE